MCCPTSALYNISKLFSLFLSPCSTYLFQLNGLLVHLPYNIEYNKVALYRHGWDIVITTDFGLTVAFDGTNNIRLTVPGAYRGDMTLQHSQVLTTNPGDFGRSWKVRDIPGCIEKEKEACPDLVNIEHTQKTSKECGLLLDMRGPFRECHSKVPPQSYFKDCVFDFCSNKTNKNAVCHIISSYAAACQAYGTRVYEWRSASFCSKFMGNNLAESEPPVPAKE